MVIVEKKKFLIWIKILNKYKNIFYKIFIPDIIQNFDIIFDFSNHKKYIRNIIFSCEYLKIFKNEISFQVKS